MFILRNPRKSLSQSATIYYTSSCDITQVWTLSCLVPMENRAFRPLKMYLEYLDSDKMWPETAKNRDEPRKMSHSSETEIFRGGPIGKLAFLAKYWHFWPI